VTHAALGIFVHEAYEVQQQILKGMELQHATTNMRLKARFNALLDMKREDTPMHKYPSNTKFVFV
jgi:hypothetical protein